MVSRKRAVEAVRAVAHGVEKGELLSFLRHLSDQDLGECGIEDGDDDETVFGFIRREAQRGALGGDAAAGLGVGSAAGAGGGAGGAAAATGAAAGPGPGSAAIAGSAAAGAGPPACKLRLRQDSQNQDLFFFEPMDTVSAGAAAIPGVSSRFFLDPEGRQTYELQDWLRLVEDLHSKGRPIVPLFINGQVKTGKSYMLNEVLPAVANTYYCSGGSGQQHAGAVLSEPNFLRVNCLGCTRTSGIGGFLKDFLLKLKESAAEQQLSAAASTLVPSDNFAGAMAVAIRDFMRRLPRDRLNFLLIDEAQSFYLMVRPVSNDCPPRGSTLDLDAVLDMRRILKELLLDSPHWVAWAVTGSSMATLWANVAATPTNGFALIMHHRRLNLSPMVPMGALQVAWEQLKAQAATWDPALPNDLVWRSRPQIAMLAYMCQEWRYSRTASTAAELVEQTMTQKLIPEVLADLRMVLQVLGQPADQIKLLRELLDPMAGVDPAKLPVPFKMLLANFATEREGRLYVDNPLLAHVLQAVTTESGKLLDSITAVQSISSKMFRELVVLGECCKDSKHFDSYEDLHSLLEDMASALALTPDGLLKADWFIHVLDHDRNSRAKVNFERNYEAQARQDVKVGLRWFHALLRNVLCHGSLEEQRKALQVYPSKLAEFHSSGRISEVLTKTYDSPMPSRSKAPGASAAAAPRAQLQPHAGPVLAARPVLAAHHGPLDLLRRIATHRAAPRRAGSPDGGGTDRPAGSAATGRHRASWAGERRLPAAGLPRPLPLPLCRSSQPGAGAAAGSRGAWGGGGGRAGGIGEGVDGDGGDAEQQPVVEVRGAGFEAGPEGSPGAGASHTASQRWAALAERIAGGAGGGAGAAPHAAAASGAAGGPGTGGGLPGAFRLSGWLEAAVGTRWRLQRRGLGLAFAVAYELGGRGRRWAGGVARALGSGIGAGD